MPGRPRSRRWPPTRPARPSRRPAMSRPTPAASWRLARVTGPPRSAHRSHGDRQCQVRRRRGGRRPGDRRGPDVATNVADAAGAQRSETVVDAPRTSRAERSIHECSPHRHARRSPAPPEGQAGGQLREVPPRTAGRSRAHDARCARRRPRRPAAWRGDAGLRHRGREASSTNSSTRRSSNRPATTGTSKVACRSRATSRT